MISAGGGYTEDREAARQLNRFSLCSQFHCLPSQLDDEDAQDVEDFLLILDLQQKYGPKPDTPEMPHG